MGGQNVQAALQRLQQIAKSAAPVPAVSPVTPRLPTVPAVPKVPVPTPANPALASLAKAAQAASKKQKPIAPAVPAPIRPTTATQTPLQHLIGAGKQVGGAAMAPVDTSFRAIGFGLSRPGQAVEHAISQSITDEQTKQGNLGTVLHAAWQGLSGQAPDVSGRSIIDQMAGGAPTTEAGKIVRDVGGFGLDVATDPLTYIPVGKLAELTRVPQVFSAVYRVLDRVPMVHDLTESAAKVFDKYHSTRPVFRQSWQRMQGLNDAAERRIAQTINRAFKGVPEALRRQFTHAIEKAPGYENWFDQHPEMQQVAQQVRSMLDQSAEGLVKRGLIKSKRPNYMPHILANHFENGFGIWTNRKTPMAASLPSGLARKLDMTIQEANDTFAKDAEWAKKLGLKPGSKLFEDDAAKLLYANLLSASQATNLHDFLQGVMSRATKIQAKDIPAVLPDGMALYRPNSLRFFRALMASPKDVEEAVTQGAQEFPLEELRPGIAISKGAAYMMPKAEADFVNGASRYRGPITGLDKVASGLRGLTLRFMLINPFTHFLHNVMWNSYLRDPGAVLNPAEWAQHVPGIIRGIDSDKWLARATEAGAVPSSALLDYRGPIAARARDVAKDLGESKVKGILKNITPFQISQHATWIPENAMRVALFRRAVQKGMGDSAAADWVNEALGNARNLSNQERMLQRFLIPFYNWEKTATAFNLKQLYRHTARATVPLHALNALNTSIVGHPLSMNPDGKQFDLELGPDKQGNQRFLNIYNPLLETLNIGQKGLPQWIFGRTQPMVKTAAAMVTGRTGFGGPDVSYPLFKYPDLQGTPAQELNNVPLFRYPATFGAGPVTGPSVNPEVATALQSLLNLPYASSAPPPSGAAEQVARVLGSFPINSAATSSARSAQYQRAAALREMRSAMRALARKGMPLPIIPPLAPPPIQ